MKKKIVLLFVVTFICVVANSQVPVGFNYQAIARDASKNPITVPIDVRFTVQSDSLGGSVFWVEEHLAVTPNEYGLFSAIIGKGARISGLAKFSDIDWTITQKFIKTEINYGGWKLLGSSRMLTVPYALVADSLGGPVSQLKVKGSATSTADEALFEVKNKNGQTVFAVYSEGVRVYVGDGTLKSPKGGFAVSGFGAEKDENNKKYFFVDDDSVRIWVNDLGKSAKGGFAVSGFGYTKDPIKRYFFASEDSVRIYIDDVAKAAKGGFAVSGFGSAKMLLPKYLSVDPQRTNVQVNDSSAGFTVSNIGTGADKSFMRMNQINYRLGHESGESLVQTIGKYNTFLGYKTGRYTTSGQKNIFIGYLTGYKNISAGYNVFLGTESGYYNQYGENNVFLGFRAGYKSLTGDNIYLGNKAGYNNDNGSANTYIGSNAGYWDGYSSYVAGSQNTFIGNVAGSNHYTGDYSVYIGSQAGYSSTGSRKVLIGYQAGYSDTRDNVLIIQNDNTKTPLIDGDFSTGVVTINSVLKLTPLSAAPASPVNGMIYINSTTNHIFCYINGTWKQLDN